MRGLAGKYTQESQKLYFNVSSSFRGKVSRVRVEKMLEQAKRSRIELADELRYLGQWLNDYENITKQY